MNCIKCNAETQKTYYYCDSCRDAYMKSDVADYHLICNKDTPKKLRDRANLGDIRINAITCLHCNDYIRSRNKHDYVKCRCGKVAVDGGSFYRKRTYSSDGDGSDYREETVLFNDVE